MGERPQLADVRCVDACFSVCRSDFYQHFQSTSYHKSAKVAIRANLEGFAGEAPSGRFGLQPVARARTLCTVHILTKLLNLRTLSTLHRRLRVWMLSSKAKRGRRVAPQRSEHVLRLPPSASRIPQPSMPFPRNRGACPWWHTQVPNWHGGRLERPSVGCCGPGMCLQEAFLLDLASESTKKVSERMCNDSVGKSGLEFPALHSVVRQHTSVPRTSPRFAACQKKGWCLKKNDALCARERERERETTRSEKRIFGHLLGFSPHWVGYSARGR